MDAQLQGFWTSALTEWLDKEDCVFKNLQKLGMACVEGLGEFPVGRDCLIESMNSKQKSTDVPE